MSPPVPTADRDDPPPDDDPPRAPHRWWLWALATVALAVVISCSGVALLLFTLHRSGSASGSAGGLTVVVRGPGALSTTAGPAGPVFNTVVAGRRVDVTPAAVDPFRFPPIPLPAGTKRVELSSAVFSGRLTVVADGVELWVEPDR